MKKSEEMVWIKDHKCKATENVESPRIALYRHLKEERWFYIIDSEKHGMICNEIKICPYCGERLNGQYPDNMIPKPLALSLDCIKDTFKDYAKFIPSVDMEIEIDPCYKYKASDFTCYGCCGCTEKFNHGKRCEFAFDPYNIGGECLMDK